jgi:hypothetical protein
MPRLILTENNPLTAIRYQIVVTYMLLADHPGGPHESVDGEMSVNRWSVGAPRAG